MQEKLEKDIAGCVFFNSNSHNNLGSRIFFLATPFPAPGKCTTEEFLTVKKLLRKVRPRPTYLSIVPYLRCASPPEVTLYNSA